MNQPPTPPSEDKFKDMLKAHGLKATSQRLAVHQAMVKLGHASADMVAEYVAANCEKSLTVSSIYNILSQMASLGIYKHRLSSNNKMYFDVNAVQHIHLYDTVNNEYKDITDPEWVSALKSEAKKHRFKGYKVEEIEVTYLCRPSRKRKTTDK